MSTFIASRALHCDDVNFLIHIYNCMHFLYNNKRNLSRKSLDFLPKKVVELELAFKYRRDFQGKENQKASF